jgi:hypothetical protein
LTDWYLRLFPSSNNETPGKFSPSGKCTWNNRDGCVIKSPPGRKLTSNYPPFSDEITWLAEHGKSFAVFYHGYDDSPICDERGRCSAGCCWELVTSPEALDRYHAGLEVFYRDVYGRVKEEALTARPAYGFMQNDKEDK